MPKGIIDIEKDIYAQDTISLDGQFRDATIKAFGFYGGTKADKIFNLAAKTANFYAVDLDRKQLQIRTLEIFEDIMGFLK
jgi:hypothetical protein